MHARQGYRQKWGWLDIAPVLGWEKGELAGVSGIINGLESGEPGENGGRRWGKKGPSSSSCVHRVSPSIPFKATHTPPWHKKQFGKQNLLNLFCLTLTTGTPSSALALMTGPWSSLGRRLRPPPPLPKMEFMSIDGRWNCMEG